MKNVCLVSLGCVKNTVDSETILGFLSKNDFNIVLNPAKADCIIINTCGFIEDAKKESLDTIFKYSKYNAKLIAVGCLVERYYEDLKESLSDVVNLFIPIRMYHKMSILIKELFEDEIKFEYNPYYRLLSTPFYTSYLKISDGCDNHCAYCAIPIIRKEFRSVKKEELIKEANRLALCGVKELVIISQDTSSYGKDIYKDYNITSLLKDLLNLNLFKSIRLLYLYAYEIDDELINLFKDNKNVLLPYFDIPIQHANDRILRLMNRKDNKKDIINLIFKIKQAIPEAILRTTLIVGFPSETEEEFLELLSFIEEYKFDRLGAFKYSKEEGTKGAELYNQIDENIKQDRLDRLLKKQSSISYSLNKERIGTTCDAIVLDYSNGYYSVRSFLVAPDDVDGKIYIKSNLKHNIGDIIKIKISNVDVYDMYGEELL